MKWIIAILTVFMVVLGVDQVHAQAVPSSGSNRLCWAHTGKDAAGNPIKGFKLEWGTSTGTYSASKDVGVGVALSTVTNPPTPPTGSVEYCSDTFKNLGITDAASYFFNVVAYDSVGNVSGPDGEVNVAPLLATPPNAPAALLVK